ncbi:hapless 8 [Abeliophyllum distichum]|uniref:Hapless 8 n=1 Tax=Abeliophyllum distichum TaxID=126358 RepID=A0ABD1UFN2_9LAMI
MLSIENPPPCPPCSCEISLLKSIGDNRDERASDDRQQLQLDLFKSGFDDNSTKFSIRDYVFDTRSNDIKTNWPFSQKKLQLCLKHGVKDLLPPFQALDSVRNPSIEKCSVEGISIDKENISNYDGKLTRSSDHLVSVSSCNVGCSQELVVDFENINSSGSEEDKEFPSTTTSQSYSEIDSVLAIKKPCLAIVTDNLPGTVVEKPESAALESNKIISSTQSPVKKCRLIVKLSNVIDPRSNENPATNASVASGTMASKVCPVCKTFSSSSNTTLNAHIDQCLSGESTIKWTANSRVTKHRIKPRKTRLMVDIYETASYCTLEELDRRNGTNWALNMGFPAQNIETCAEEGKKTSPAVNLEDTNKESAVYIDSDGTKLRILSKFNDLQTFSNINDDSEPMKLVKRDKERKTLLNHCSNIIDGREMKFLIQQSTGKEGCVAPLPIAHDLIKFNHLGIIKQWVGSKRSDLPKKINGKDENQQSDKSVRKNLRAKSHQPSTGDRFMKRSSLLNSQALPDENQLSPPERSKRKENLSCDSHDEYGERSLRKRVSCSSLESKGFHYKKKHLVSSQCNVKQLRKGGLSVDDCHMDLQNSTEYHAPSQSTKRVVIDVSPAKHADSSVVNPKPYPRHAFSSGSKMFSSSGENMLSVRRTSLFGSKTKMKRKWLDVKKLRVRYRSGSDEEAVASQFALDPQHDLVEKLSESADQMEEISDRINVDRTRALKIHKKRREFMISRKEEAMALRCSQPSPESNHHDSVESVGKEVAIREDIVSEPASEIANGELSMVLSNSMDPRLSEDADPDVQLVSQHYIEAYKEHYPAEPVLDGEHKMFCADDHMVGEFDIDEEQGKYFVGVDPIPIPGPPGSFLPSPGHMGSEDLQGNSSLTTCRVQSSEDDHELVDMDSSYSPISATSKISNSFAARSDSISLEKLPVGSPVGNEIKSGFSGASIDPVVGMSPFKPTENAGEGKLNLDGSNVDVMFPEMGSLRFKISQRCCCSRKEGASQSVALNYQDSELWQRTLASLSLPADEKQMVADPKIIYDSSNFRSEKLSVREPSMIAEADVANSPSGFIPMKVSIDSEAKLSSHGDFESASPGTSNPILRLMGKNLMVVKKDEDVTAQSSITNVLAKPQFYVDNGVSPGKFQKEDHHSFHHMVSKDPLFDHAQNHTLSPHFDVGSSGGFKIHSSVRTPQSSPHPPPVSLSSKSFGGSFRSSECHEYIGSCHLSAQQQGSKNKLGVPIAYDTDKVRNPSGYNINEIIVIDDTPVSKADLDIETTHGKENKKGRESTVGISASMNIGYDSRHGNPFYSYQSRGYSICSESPLVLNASCQAPHPKGIKTNPVKWNCTPEGSSVMDPYSLTAPSSSTCHLKSEMYYSPGFS